MRRGWTGRCLVHLVHQIIGRREGGKGQQPLWWPSWQLWWCWYASEYKRNQSHVMSWVMIVTDSNPVKILCPTHLTCHTWIPGKPVFIQRSKLIKKNSSTGRSIIFIYPINDFFYLPVKSLSSRLMKRFHLQVDNKISSTHFFLW